MASSSTGRLIPNVKVRIVQGPTRNLKLSYANNIYSSELGEMKLEVCHYILFSLERHANPIDF